MKPPRPLEKEIQRNVRAYLTMLRIEAIHIPNGAVLAGDKVARAKQSAALKRAGTLKGCPDLLLIQRTQDGHRVAWMEVKREGEKLRPEQKDFADKCTDWRMPFAVVRSVDDAQESLREWGWIA
jgi:hypothetical protein